MLKGVSEAADLAEHRPPDAHQVRGVALGDLNNFRSQAIQAAMRAHIIIVITMIIIIIITMISISTTISMSITMFSLLYYMFFLNK